MFKRNLFAVKKRRPRLSLSLAAVLALVALLLTVIPANAVTIVNREINTGGNPVAMAVNPVTNKIYVVGTKTTVIDGATNNATTFGGGGNSLAVNPIANKIYIVSTSSNVVRVMDGTTNNATVVPVGTYPNAVAVNQVTNKIYVANGDGTVTVIDGATNSTISVTTGTGNQAIAINPATNKIYVVNYNYNSVTVIDGATNSTTQVTTGKGPQAVAVNPATNQIYVANSLDGTVTVIDGATNNTATVATGSGAKFVAVNPVTNKIYVFNNTTVTVVDGANNGTLTLGCPGVLAQAIVVNPATNKIYVGNHDKLMIIDGATNTTSTMNWESYALAVNPVTNKLYDLNYAPTDNSFGCVSVIDCSTNSDGSCGTTLPVSNPTLPVGVNPDAVAVNPATNKTYVANYTSGTVTVIDGTTSSTDTVNVGAGPRDIAVNPATNKTYVVNNTDDTVTVIDGTTNSTTPVIVGKSPSALAVNLATNKIYVANTGSNNVTVINGVTYSATVTVGTSPIAVAVNLVTNKIYVANQGDGSHNSTVTVIDGATNSTTTVAVGIFPVAVAVNPVTNKIYVANQHGDTVTVIDGVDNSTTTVSVGTSPNAIAVNPATNKIYVGNYGNGTVSVIDGITNKITTVNASLSWAIAVNPATNQIYGTAASSGVSVIDGSTNHASYVEVSEGGNPAHEAIAVNPATNKVYVANLNSATVTVIDIQPVQDVNPLVNITPLNNNVTALNTANFTFSALNTSVLPVQQIWYQVDSLSGMWQQASPAGSSASATLSSLNVGTHVLYVMATDGQDATSINTGFSGSPITGKTVAYAFTVVPAAVMPNINPQSQNVLQDLGGNAQFTVGATVNDGGTLTFQWQVSTDNGGTWNNISGATDKIYTTAPITMSDVGTQYRCLITNTKIDSVTTVTSNAATITLKTYTITYSGNGNTGGSVPVDSNAYLRNAFVTVLDNTGNLVKTGYSFGGWNIYTDGSGTNYTPGSTFRAMGMNQTLYAKWTINTYTVTFNSNGGSEVNSQIVNYNSKATAVVPLRTGYTFAGWYSDSGLTTVFNLATTAITSDITLYAKWAINTYTVTFNSNGGSAVGSQSVLYNMNATAPTSTARTGYTFNGWYSDSGLTTVFDFATAITGNITLYAKWTINTYTVTFNSNGGSTVSSQTVNYNQVATKPTDPTRTAFFFAGWYSDSVLATAFNFSTAITANITLYAKWIAAVATPTFDPDSRTFTSAWNVKISCATPGAVIHYTTNGKDPGVKDPVVGASGLVAVNKSMTLKAAAWKSGLLTSYIKSASYIVTGTVATPTFSVKPGLYYTSQTISISSTPGAIIRYTTDGSEPTLTTNGIQYSVPISLAKPTTIKAKAWLEGWDLSATATATYNITGTVPTPSFSVPEGKYDEEQTVYVNLSDSNFDGAVIRYTTNGTTPTATSPVVPGGGIQVTHDMKITAMAWKTNWKTSAAASANYTFSRVATPVISLASGTYTSAQSITITCATPGAVINYTINGSPSKTYSGKITLAAKSGNTDIVAIAAKKTLNPSFEASASYKITGTVATPVISSVFTVIGAGTTQDVKMSCSTDGAMIYYTTDGSTPTTSSAQYTGPFTVNGTITIKAIAVLKDWLSSAVATVNYTGTVPTPSFSVPEGKYDEEQTVYVNLSDSNFDGAVIRYTTNGTTPTATSPVVPGGGIQVTHDMKITAMAWKTNWKTSAAASANYTFSRVATPVISLASGTYTSAQSITITCATPGAVINYTINGGPSKTYSGKITLAAKSGNTDIVAIAAKKTLNPSFEASASYKITGTVATPVISSASTVIGAGTTQDVKMSCSTDGAMIYYTTDGSAPTTSSAQYTGPFTVNGTTTIKAIAVLKDWLSSAVATVNYTGTVPTPSFSVLEGKYDEEQTVYVNLSDSNFDGAVIRYTTNGTTPTATSPVVPGGGIQVTHDIKITAMAWKTNWKTSAAASANYTFSRAATPVIGLASGTYTSAQSITITCATPGAVINYTINGSPSKTYSGKITLAAKSGNTNIVAIATKKTLNPSAEASASYKITGTVATPVISSASTVIGAGTTQDVKMSCSTDGAMIYYTTDGSAPTTSSAQYTGPFTVNGTTTIKAIAVLKDWLSSAVATVNYTGTVPTPSFSVPEGKYDEEQTVYVNLSDSNFDGAVIRYTTNGTTPTATSPVVPGGGILINKTTTLMAKAWKTGWSASGVQKAVYTFTGAATPVFNIAEGIYTSAQKISIASTAGATIRYTIGGGNVPDPDLNSSVYKSGSPIPIPATMTLKAKAWVGTHESKVQTATYTITGTVPAPVLSLSPGTYPGAQNVTIRCTASNAVIHYTVNGKEPTVNDPVINSGDSLAVLTTETVKAKAWQKDWLPSATASATYTISQVAAPVISPDGGNYEFAQSVTISCITPGAVIHYTLNGNDPTLSDPVIPTGEAITISSDTPVTLKARAWKNGLYTSNITTAVFQNTILLSVAKNGNGSMTFDGSRLVTYRTVANISTTSKTGSMRPRLVGPER